VKILLVTGRQAYRMVMDVAERIMRENPGLHIDVLALPIPVAAMMNAIYLQRELASRIDYVKQFNLVIVPGYTRGDVADVSEKLGVPVVKGTLYIEDLSLMINALLGGAKFSTIDPADSILESEKKRVEHDVLEEARKLALVEMYFDISGLPISSHYPLVVLEIYVEEPSDLYKYKRAAKYADLVSIEVSMGFNSSRAREFINKAKELFGKPVGIDTAELELAIEVSGDVDFINGIRVSEVDELLRYVDRLRGKPIVLLGDPEKTPVDEALELERVVKFLVGKGFSKIIVDPVLMPPLNGLVKSLETIIYLRSRTPSTPLLIGAGNITELSDVDSVGLNALIVFIGVELGVELYLTTEASTKTRGSTRELRRAIEMAIIAKKLRKPPKDLSFNLLCVKSKKAVREEPPKPREIACVYEKPEWRPDPNGFFRIYVDHDEGVIRVYHYLHGSREPSIELRSIDPYAILKAVIERKLASSFTHFFYLGYELSKAKIALMTSREYIQDKEFFEANTCSNYF